MFSIIGLQALWASSIPLSKILLTFTSPVFLTGIRMSIAGALLLSYKYLFTDEKINFQSKHLWFYAQIIFFGIYLRYVLRYWGLSHMTAGKMSFILNCTPFVVALFSYFSFHEKLSIKQWIGLSIGFIGLIPILQISSPAEKIMGEFFIFSWPELAIFAEVCAHSYGLIVMRKMVCDNGYSSGMTNGIRMLGGGLLALVTAFFIEGSIYVTDVHSFIGYLVVLIILGNIICHNLYVLLLKYYSATLVAFTEFLSPIFVTFYGWLFLHEAITWHYFFSTIIVFSGLYLFYQDELFKVTQKMNVAKPA